MAGYNVTLIPGDGIGPEVTEATRRVLEATGVEFTWDYQEAGMTALEKHGDLLPEATLDSVRSETRSVSRGRSPRRLAAASAASMSVCARHSGSTPTSAPARRSRACNRRSTTSIWSLSARTSKACTPGSSSTPARPKPPRSSRGSTRTARSRWRPMPRDQHQGHYPGEFAPDRDDSPSNTPAPTGARRSRSSTRRTS